MFSDDTPVLNSLALLALTGPDAVDFLQNYVTTDILSSEPGELQLTTCCNRQGRVISDLDFIRNDSGCHLILHKDCVKLLTDHLAPFLAFTQSKLEPMINWRRYCLPVAAAPESVPASGYAHCQNGVLWLKYSYLQDFVLCWTSPETKELEGNADTNADAIDDNDWQQAEIAAGRVRVVPEIAGGFLPQMLGYEKFNGVSYDKGCYLGQEIIARAHYRGDLKSSLQLLGCEPPAPVVGTVVLDDSGRKLGTLVGSTLEAGGLGCLLLAVLRKNHDEPKMHLEGTDTKVHGR